MPLLPFIQAGAGLAQSIISGIKARKATKQLENLETPNYEQNQSLANLYNNALTRYNVSPTDSALYKRNMNDVNRNVASSISGLSDRRAGLIGIPALLRAKNDAMLNSEVQAENQRNQRFNELGNITNQKVNDDRMAFQINKMLPYEKKYNLLSQKAGAANQGVNAGLSNIFGGLSSLSNYSTAKRAYQNTTP